MPKSVTLLYSIIEVIVLAVFYYRVRKMVNIYWYFGVHIIIIIVLGLLLLNIDPKKIIKKKKLIERYGFEYGVIKGRVITNNSSVLEEGEKVQVLDKLDESVLVRKANGNEYNINKNMIEIKCFK